MVEAVPHRPPRLAPARCSDIPFPQLRPARTAYAEVRIPDADRTLALALYVHSTEQHEAGEMGADGS